MSAKEGNWFVRHKVLTVLLVIVGLVIVVSASGSGSKESSSSSNSQDTKTEENKTETVAKLDQPARDGQFEFVVKGVECGKPSVTDSSGYVTQTAQGQYCLLTISVKNIGDKQQMFLDSDQKLLNAEGQQFSPDSTATLTNGNNQNVWLAQINPGNTVEGVLVYDIPKDQTPVAAQLHDSSFSNGVKVNLQ